jgi:phage FluMu gp28-like protein
VLFDEAGFIDGIDGVYQAAMPTLSMLGDRGKVIFNSTPNGKTGLFYRLLSGWC